jgi:hypothetical protein
MISDITQLFISVTDVAAALSFTNTEGRVTLFNSGAQDCWITFNGLPAAASDANGRSRLKSLGSIGIDLAALTSIGFICAAALTTGVQVIVTQNAGNSSANGFGM